MNQQIIEKWKQNRVRTDLLTDEEYAELKQLDKSDLVFWSNILHSWEKPSSCEISNFFDIFVYRLRPDYQPPKPEPKIVKCEVKNRDILEFRYKDTWWYLHYAVNIPAFSHFEYDNSTKSNMPRVFDINDKPAAIPKYVAFVENENG